jgi:hypothetical protein
MTESTAAITTRVAPSAAGAQGGAAVARTSGQSSVDLRVAAIRAEAARRSAAHSPDAAAVSADRPAQVAWNDWKNE